MKISSLALFMALAVPAPTATFIIMTSDNPKKPVLVAAEVTIYGAIVRSNQTFAGPVAPPPGSPVDASPTSTETRSDSRWRAHLSDRIVLK